MYRNPCAADHSNLTPRAVCAHPQNSHTVARRMIANIYSCLSLAIVFQLVAPLRVSGKGSISFCFRFFKLDSYRVDGGPQPQPTPQIRGRYIQPPPPKDM